MKFKAFEPNYFCEITVPVCKEEHFRLRPAQHDIDRILSDKPEFIKDNNYINKLYKEMNADKLEGKARETMLVYHFSDLHWNLDYQEGSSNECEAIVC